MNKKNKMYDENEDKLLAFVIKKDGSIKFTKRNLTVFEELGILHTYLKDLEFELFIKKWEQKAQEAIKQVQEQLEEQDFKEFNELIFGKTVDPKKAN